MTYPDCLYYDEKREQAQYSDTPRGTLDVNRLVHGLPAWRYSSLAPYRKPKALVFADWFAIHWTFIRLEDVKKKLLKLMEDGFELYVWHNQKVEKLRPETIHCLDQDFFRDAITFESVELIKKAAVNQQGLTYDQVFVLDDYWINFLLKGQDNLEPREVSETFLRNIVSSDLLKLETIYQHAIPPLATIVIDEYPISADVVIDGFNENNLHFFSSIPVTVRYETLLIDEDFSISNAMSTDLSNIKWLLLDLDTNDEAIQKLVLQLMPKLIKISFSKYSFIDFEDKADAVNLDNLVTLDINASPIKPKSLQLILERAKNLRELSIKNYADIQELNFEKCNLQHLEKLVIDNCNISVEGFLALTSKSPKLKVVRIISLSCILEGLSKSSNIKQVEELYFGSASVDVALLQKTLSRTPNLRVLDLTNKHAEADSVALDDGFQIGSNCSKLEVLEITNRNCSARFLQSFLSQPNGLKTLNLYQCNESAAEDDRFTQALYLASLEELIIRFSNINDENLHALLSKAPNLKLLNLQNMGSPNWIRVLLADDVELRHLKTLILPKKGCSAETLPKLLFKMPMLTELTLPFFFDKNKQIILDFNLDHIEHIVAKNARMNAGNVFVLLAKAPQIQSINLSNWKNTFEGQLFKNPLNLTNLKKLNVASSNITPHILECFIARSTSLVELNISLCENLGSEPIRGVLNLEKLELLDIRFSKIHPETIKALIKAAPNLKTLKYRAFQMDAECNKLIRKIKCKAIENSAKVSGVPRLASTTSTPSKKAPKATTQYTEKLDADTGPDDEALQAQRHFYPLDSKKMQCPHPLLYRRFVFDKIGINKQPCQLNDAFTMAKNTQTIPVICHIPDTQDIWSKGKKMAAVSRQYDYYMGRQEFILTNEWQGMVSLSPSEEIKYYQISHKDTHKTVKIEIAYSSDDNLYYIRKKGSGSQLVGLDFLVAIKKNQQPLELPSEIQAQIAFFKTFESHNPKPLDLSHFPNPTGHHYLFCILEQKSGSCRHRAFAFKAMMEQAYPHIPTRIICNDCHAYVEIFMGSQWHAVQLGGHMGLLNIDEGNRPESVEIDTDETDDADTVANADENQFRKALKTWKKKKDVYDSVLTYCEHLCQNNLKKKRLVEFTSNDDVKAMYLSLLDYCQRTSRPVFYIHSPDDLICSAPFIKRDEYSDIGILTPGPGGALYDFLQTHAGSNPPPVLVVNYAKFSADDIVRFNAILNKKREIDGIELPEDMQLIGLINTQKPDCYQGEDFYARFDQIDTKPLESKQLKAHEEIIAPIITSSSTAQSIQINLYHSLNWREQLLGHWVIEQDHFRFKEGELWAALDMADALSCPIDIRNGPWGDEQFQLFWQQARLQGEIHYAGMQKHFPKHISIGQREGYNWEQLKSAVVWESHYPAQAHALNPGTLSDYFGRYEYDSENHKLNPRPGLLETYQGRALPVCLTRALSEGEWALLLAACKKHGVTLAVYSPSNIKNPDFLYPETGMPVVVQPLFDESDKNVVLLSNEPDTTLAHITESDPLSWQVIDISECEGNDLLIHTSTKMNARKGELLFFQKEQALIQALNEGKKVILKGYFSPSLLDELAVFLLTRLQHPQEALGQLVFLTENADDFPFMLCKKHEVDSALKKVCLSITFKEQEIGLLSEEQLKNDSLSQLKARLCYQQRQLQTVDTDKAWEGLYHLPETINLSAFNEKDSQAIAEGFNKKRLNMVNAALQHSPYVFLAGLTGVGKSTFVEKVLSKDSNITLYKGESQMTRWALDQSQKRKILFIDEANLSSRQWSEFEGLFHQPPGMLIDGVFHELSSEHQVIFAGNPLHYGDERQLAPLFARHGNTVVFEPLPMEYIYEFILKPVFEESEMDEAAIKRICIPMLQIYAFLCSCSKDKILISPRELQMMALLTRSIYQQNKYEEAAIFAAGHYAYQLGRGLVPAEQKKFFDDHYKPQKAWDRPSLTDEKADFLITPSREAVGWQMVDLLLLREFKQKYAANDSQKYGGLGGMIIEGSPGIGKSELAVAILLACGYSEMPCFPRSDEPPRTQSDKVFYRIPVSMQTEDKKRLLLKAFHEGAVVIIDEINSSPMMERLLNDLLMGKTPEGMPPMKPGFMVLGTQNPVTMAGRRAPSTALQRRLITTVLSDYPKDEIEQVLMHKGLAPDTVATMVKAFQQNRSQALSETKSPVPTLRDLLKLADDVLKGKTRSSMQILAFESLKNNLLQAFMEYQPWLSKMRFQFFGHDSWSEESVYLLQKNITEAKDIEDMILGLQVYFNEVGSEALDLFLLRRIIESPLRNLLGLDNVQLRQIQAFSEKMITQILEYDVGNIRQAMK